MNEPKFTKNMKPFCEKYANGRFNIGVEDSEHTVLCYTAGGNPETRRANVTLWSASDEMYDFINFFETFAGQCYCKILGEAGQKIYDEAVRICKKARGEQ